MKPKTPKTAREDSPEFSGAHRYTILRMVRAPFGESCRRHCSYRSRAKGDVTLPLQHKERAYPFVQSQNSITTVKRGNPDLRFFRVLSRKVVMT